MELLRDLRWGIAVVMARRARRVMLFSQRQAFDAEVRPRLQDARIAYPDAIYHITIDDVSRGLAAARQPRAK